MPNRPRSFTLLAVGFWLGACALGGGTPDVRGDAPASPPSVRLTEGLALGSVGWSARWPVHKDPIEARIVAGTWTWPAAGDSVDDVEGLKRAWTPVKAGADGAFSEGLDAGGYLALRVASETERVAILHASGHGFVYVNGEIRTGDPYGYRLAAAAGPAAQG